MFRAGLWLALAALGGCGAESHLSAAEAAATAPLSEPAEIDLTQSGGICDEGPDGLSILRSPPGINLVSDFRRGGRTADQRGGSVQEFSGLVLNLLDELPAAAAQYFDPSIGPDQIAMLVREYAEEYPVVACLAVDGTQHYLAGRTRSLGLRAGMTFDARLQSQSGWSWHRILTLRSKGETVLHHVSGAILPGEYALPGGLRAEREQLLCNVDVLLGGDVYSLRVSNEAGESIVLLPGQARTLGEYDVYLWAAIYPDDGRQALRGIDAPESIVELAVVRRPLNAD
jgi:hypothetical protein